jgi:hypothetical protein
LSSWGLRLQRPRREVTPRSEPRQNRSSTPTCRGMAHASRFPVAPSNSSDDRGLSRAGADAPGAIPPTGGAPPENAPPAGSSQAETRSATDDLVDGIDLMLRAARKAMRSVDPRIEQAAERALNTLQELDEKAGEPIRRTVGAIDPKRVETLAAEAGREIASLVERIAGRVESELGRRK